jgi:hypothetical protein
MEADWDNLIILDGCRFDLFEEVNHIDGELISIVSRGSHTGEFLRRNFKNDDHTFGDTVYISANPQILNHGVDHLFYNSVRAWESNWDKEIRTVHPSELTNIAIKKQDEYIDKRLIIHYLQPHYPFIGSIGSEIEHRTVDGDGVISDPDESPKSVWERLRDNELSQSLVWEAYRENLELTLPHIEKLVDELYGKTVITSDHGNAFGRFGVYGHPGGVYINELVKVPWLEIQSENRKRILKEGVSGKSSSNNSVEKRLADLGYK